MPTTPLPFRIGNAAVFAVLMTSAVLLPIRSVYAEEATPALSISPTREVSVSVIPSATPQQEPSAGIEPSTFPTSEPTATRTPSPEPVRESTIPPEAPSATAQPSAPLSPTATKAPAPTRILRFASANDAKARNRALIERMKDLGIPHRRDAMREASRRAARLPSSTADASRDVVIAVNLRKAPDDQIGKLLALVAEETDKGTMVEYFDTDRTNTFFLTLDEPEATVAEMRKAVPDAATIKIAPDRIYLPSYSPTDPLYASQYALTNIRYSDAVDSGIGLNSPVIAIVDNGVNVDHEDLASRIWINSGEIYGNSVDDDANGYVDDRFGCNFYEYHSLSNTSTSCNKDKIRDGVSQTTHGSHAAMIAASATNNGIGAAGVCPTCRIMVLDVANNSTSGAPVSAIAYGLQYAIDKGADLVNFSYASSCPFGPSEDVLDTTIDTLVNSADISFVQAAGNNGDMSQSSCISTCGGANSYCSSGARNQAYYYVDGKSVTNKITVAALTSSNARASYSNFDPAVGNRVITVAAPGDNVLVSDGSLVSGTSFAAPHVSGAIGMALTKTSLSTLAIYTRLTTSGSSSVSTDQNVSGRKLDLYKMMNPSKWTYEGVAYYVYIPPDQSGKMPVYRFRNESLGMHFYTASEDERQNTVDNYASKWTYEGIAFYVYTDPDTDRTPVYRFRNEALGIHFYTASDEERDNTIDNYADRWIYEGIAYYVHIPPDHTGGGKTPVYRFSDPTLGAHFYTASEEERLSL
jgi:hypothetical protein